jgi:hypothetical protein
MAEFINKVKNDKAVSVCVSLSKAFLVNKGRKPLVIDNSILSEILLNFFHAQWIFGKFFAPVLVNDDGIFISKSDVVIRAGILHGADEHLVFLVNMIRIGPVRKWPVI